MDNTAEVLTRRNGTGCLVLKSGSGKQVQWEVDYLRDGSLGDGCIRGDEAHLAAAANDGCATVCLTSKITAAIAIENQEHGEASFSPLLVSMNVFRAQTINDSKSISDGNQIAIEFSDADSRRFLMIVPTIVLRDYLPVLEETVRPAEPASATTGFFRFPQTWKTGTSRSYPFVLLGLNDEEPFGLSPEEARELAAELIEGAKEVDSRSQTAQ
jgi:hypothetical protein